MKAPLERFVKSFRDLVILSLLSERSSIGYEIIGSIHDRYGIMLSPAMVYGTLDSLEKEGLIAREKPKKSKKEKAYSITQSGLARLRHSLDEFREAYGSLMVSAEARDRVTRIETVLSALFGETGSKTILRLLEDKYSLTKRRIEENPDAVYYALERLFGAGAPIIRKALSERRKWE
ncbi:MAG: PadR family transcriptional regulator [Candidatus Bathyarchaeia archaeon]